MQLSWLPMARHTTQLAAWRSLLAAHAGLVDVLAAEMKAEHDLPLGWYEVLLYLHESGSDRLRMHELAESLLLSRSAVTRFIERMESAGLVIRIPCERDRRGTFVVLTDEGRAAFERAAPFHLDGIRRHFADHVSDDEAAVIAAVMERLASRLKSVTG